MNMPAKFPIPANEAARLKALDDLAILDTLAEPQFDALSKLGARLFNVPICLVSLVAVDRQWFKAKHGFELCETPRELAFCNYPIASGQIVTIEDATADPRVASNPLVTQDGGIRFYAGCPIGVEADVSLGTVCIVDVQPRTFSIADQEALIELAEVASSLLKAHQRRVTAETQAAQLAGQATIISTQAVTLATQKRVLDQAAKIAKIGAWESDTKSGALIWSDGMFEIHGMEIGTPVPYGPHYNMYLEPHRTRLKEAVGRAHARGEPFDVEGPAITADGRKRWFRVVGAPVDWGQPSERWCGMKQDITEQKRLKYKLETLARRDPVTGLANRSACQAALQDAVKQSAGQPVTLLLIDLDDFKGVNDAHGHAAGDQCLRQIASRLRSLQAEALVARLGGDEFAIIPDRTVDADAGELARRIIEAIRRPIECNGAKVHLGASVGIVTAVCGVSDLMKRADLALYSAKDAGRGVWRFFTPELQVAAEAKTAHISQIYQALANRQLEVHYQQQVELATGAHASFEALVRWRQPDGVVLAPGAFSAALDDPELSRQIGDYVLDEVVRQAREWTDADVAFGRIAVNLSASQFADGSLVAGILDRLNTYQLQPSCLEVEVTENVFIGRNASLVKDKLGQLRRAGIRVALDDFGTGYASLSHLREFQVDTLKIDRSFVSRLGRTSVETAIVQAIALISLSLETEIVAEGIETATEAEYLKALGCRYGQGYLFAKPMPAPECARLTRGHNIRMVGRLDVWSGP
ncbi:sensor domain-containing phosphodiesterase [Mongoliimonas terrestris]|uniref:sensor domain-containing phosphodiesterase n=1 Tax=Mongoliimonas terrestris TaxID=1709001 RepID=UPI00094964AD|nr:EAL domain-containing protein [Mongoliimonas terrestris]